VQLYPVLWLGGLRSAGACLISGFRVIESGRTLLDTRGQDGAAPAMEFQTGTLAVVSVHAPRGHAWLVCVCTVASTHQARDLRQPPSGVLP
jgi:hypothetical protein